MGLVVGEISYTNIRPMFHYLNRERLASFSFVPAIPAELNKKMAAGMIDVGGISSFAYGQNIDDYHVLADLSVSSYQQVGSIFLFTKKKLEELDGEPIALTSSSATSVHLLKILLRHFYRVEPRFYTQDPDFNEMMERASACLLIGDDAIRAKWNHEAEYFCYDLGKLWYEHTGLPMTYAVFAVRKEMAALYEESLASLYEGFHESKRMCKSNHYHDLITSIQREHGGTFTFWQSYFAKLNHDLTSDHLDGLHMYYDLAYQYGYLSKPVKEISVWNPVSPFHSV
ncbi:menaquinone biosynthesis protein [Paenalkalicoccus suaedae]|uniref:Chorismate dehydratase n=1 Tax=Paenalkalicoccus suaedae TaxID=2592382 RepID=A0A859FDZ2_9BACI|nr:menaquinone biosynthesis protein [Paenalkalicoccus suaedae]QKS71091.1 menaquinone biosynthesis protein [Paenalkalicoccus suaedae]